MGYPDAWWLHRCRSSCRPIGHLGPSDRSGCRVPPVGRAIVTRGPLRLSCRARALVDAAAGCADPAAARALIIDAVQQRLVRLDDVAHWVEARSNHGRRRLRQALAEAAIGAWSVPEADLLRLVSGHGRLPEPWANPVLHDAAGRRLTTPDLWIDDVALGVMVHSRAFHSGVLDWEATVAADEDLRAAGIEVVAVTPASIATQPERVLARIDAAYGRRRADRDRPGWWRSPEPTRGRPPKRLPKRLDGREHDRMAATRVASQRWPDRPDGGSDGVGPIRPDQRPAVRSSVGRSVLGRPFSLF